MTAQATPHAAALPPVIQGGMGVGVSDWRLARAVSAAGQLGVVSGTALDVLLARRLQLGDPEGHLRRALAAFPDRALADRVLARWFVPGGKARAAPFRRTEMPSAAPSRAAVELTVVANFAEVHLAREGHGNPVGINYLEKIQTPTLPALYGALLAGVGVVIVGAGIPRAFPALLDALAAGRPAALPLAVAGGALQVDLRFDPADFLGTAPPQLARPLFLPIVSSATLARVLLEKSSGRIDGFVVEAPTAGGHNAPPRGAYALDAEGQPVYGPRDVLDVAALRALGVPFWLAGGRASAEALAAARAEGAAGIQVGTAFAFCDESGIAPDLKRRVHAAARDGALRVRTDPRASPTGFPFKVLELPGCASDPAVVAARRRRCDLGFLRHAYAAADGALGWRCPSEHEAAYAAKGGDPADCAGRLCVCNGLVATIGLGQTRDGERPEAPLLTCGDDVGAVRRFVKVTGDAYSAQDVLAGLLAPTDAP